MSTKEWPKPAPEGTHAVGCASLLLWLTPPHPFLLFQAPSSGKWSSEDKLCSLKALLKSLAASSDLCSAAVANIKPIAGAAPPKQVAFLQESQELLGSFRPGNLLL